MVGAEGVEESAAEPYLCGNAPVISMKPPACLLLSLNAIVGLLLSSCMPSTVYFAPHPSRVIESIPATGGAAKVLVPQAPGVKALAVSPSHQMLFASLQSSIHVWNLTDGQSSRLVRKTASADCLAVDEAGQRLYRGDNRLRQIASCDFQGKETRILVSEVSDPREIAVNPIRGLLYWIQENPGRGIWMADLDGKGRKVIGDRLQRVSALAVDSCSGRVFWAQSGLGGTPTQITTANFDGSNPEVIFDAPNRFIAGLAVDEAADRIIWTERNGNDPALSSPALIKSANFDGSSVKTIHDFTGNTWARAITVGPSKK